MSGVRVLVGTRKGAFILTSDGKRQNWDVSGPHFAGWEIYHLKGSPVDPNRLYASQSSGWFGQMIQRSNDGGKTWEPVGNKFVYDGVARHAPVVRRHAAPVGVQARLASRAVADRTRHGLCRRRGRRDLPHDRRRAELARAARPARPRLRVAWRPAPAACACTRSCWIPTNPSGCSSRSPQPERSAPTTAANLAADEPGAAAPSTSRPERRGRPLRPPHRHAPLPAERAVHAEALGRHAQRQRRRSWHEVSGNLPTDFGFPIDVHAHEPETIYVVPIKSDSEHYPPEGKLRVYRSRTGGNEWEALTNGLPQKDCYVNVLRDAMAVDALDQCGVYFGTTGGQVYVSPDGGDSWAPIVRDLPAVLSVEAQTL